MALRISNNVASLNAQRHINKSSTGLSKALERLSSGFRVNRAADDAAGLAISEKLRANTRALTQASRNASDGVSVVQTAEGALDEIGNMLVRMKELAEQASTGTVGDEERGYIQDEYDALRDEITRVGENTKFNDTLLFDGNFAAEVQIGIEAGSGNVLTVSIDQTDSATLSLTASISDASNASTALTTISTAIETVSTQRAQLGALQNRLESIVSNIDTQVENLTASESRIRDADIASETANLTKYSILVQAGISVLSQANQTPQIALSLLG
jgi:flagellin